VVRRRRTHDTDKLGLEQCTDIAVRLEPLLGTVKITAAAMLQRIAGATSEIQASVASRCAGSTGWVDTSQRTRWYVSIWLNRVMSGCVVLGEAADSDLWPSSHHWDVG
jgi:hypothetical protein